MQGGLVLEIFVTHQQLVRDRVVRVAVRAAILDVEQELAVEEILPPIHHREDAGFSDGARCTQARDLHGDLAARERLTQDVPHPRLFVRHLKSSIAQERGAARAFSERLSVHQRVVELTGTIESDELRAEACGARPGRR